MKKFNMNKLAIAVVAGTVWSSAAVGAETTDSFEVTTTVAAQCQVSTPAADLSFGAYDAVNKTALEGSTAIGVTCTDGAGVTVALAGANDATTTRRLKHETKESYLTYVFYSDALKQNVWGNDGASDQTFTADGTEKTVNIYGELSGNETASVGTYSDTVTATITF